MKKVFSVILGIFLMLGIIVPLIPKVESEKTQAFVSESEILNKKDIIPIHKSEMDLQLINYAKENQTPFDSNTQALMEGCSITPATIEYNQISNVSYGVSRFTMGSGKSIYLWVYFPDNPLENYYSFEIAIENEQEKAKISWLFTPDELDTMLKTFNAESYGWKFLELPYSGAIGIDNVNNTTEFIKFTINYKYIPNEFDFANSFKYYTNDTLSIYHVYVGDS